MAWTSDKSEAQQRDRGLVDHVPGVVWEYDVVAGRLVFVGGRVEALVGWTAEQLLNETFWAEQIHPDDRAYVAASMQPDRDLAGVEVEYRMRTADGSYRWFRHVLRSVRDEGRFRVHGIGIDVTARKEAEEALRRSEQDLRAMIEGAPDAMIVHLGRQIVYANAAAARFLGYECPADLQGRTGTDLLLAEDREIARERQEALARGEPVAPRESRWRRKDGTLRYGESTMIPVTFGGTSAFLMIIRDTQERREMQSHMLVADRMASVGTLAAGVAHEINNPLSFVLANLHFVRNELASRPDVPQAVRVALDEATLGGDRVRSIVGELKAFSRVESEEVQHAVELHGVLQASLALARNEIRHRATLEVRLDPVPQVLGSEARLGQVILNLLINAAQAIPDAGDPTSHRIRLACGTDPRGWAVIQVEDTGGGIPEAIRNRIFDPFFTTKPVGVGTGLGLSICHRTVAQLGGRLDFTTHEGRGTCFVVELPPAPPAAAAPVTEPEPLPPAAPLETEATPPRILVVDDEPMVGRAIQRSLGNRYQTELADSAQAALDRLAADDRFDVVLCDLMMPGLTGMDLHERLEAEKPAVAARMVFVTGGAFTERARAFLARPDVHVIAKPFSSEALRGAVEERLSTLGRA